MSSTNKTEHYNLPQFIGSDIPTWLGDINSAMTAIDSGINAAASSASGAATTAAQALTDAEAAQNALNAKANTSTLATVESTSTASQAYSVGDYLVYNGILYRVTAAIRSGQTLVPGTNITDTTAGAELASLNNGLNNSGSTYIKLPDGTAFAWGRIKFEAANTTGTKIATETFPLTFIAQPAAVISWCDSQHVFEYFNAVSVYNPGLTANTFTAVANQIHITDVDWFACYIAIGKWK